MTTVGPYVITLQEVRTHLRIPATNFSEDDMLQNTFIPAVSDVIKAECGDIIPTTYAEYYDGGDFSIWLKHTPILEVMSVQEGWGFTKYELDYVQVNATAATSMFAYSIDRPAMGQITRRSGGNVNIKFMHGNSNVRVVYVAGHTKVPAAVKLAALLLLEFWYQGSEQRASAYLHEATGYNAMDVAEPTSGGQGGLIGINVGIPYKVLELLRPYRHMPFIG